MLQGKRKRLILIVAVLVSTAFMLSTVAAEILRYPTYQYYGQTLSAQDFLKLVEANIPLHCSPLPNAGLFAGNPAESMDYVCFNTQEELNAHIDTVLDPEWDRILRENPITAPAKTDTTVQKRLLTDH